MITLFFILFYLSFLAVFYSYIGYPVLIYLFSRIFSKPEKYTEIFPHITVLIPAYNEEKYIAKKLDNTLEIDYPREKMQILVAADGSSDATPDIVKSYANNGIELSYIPERNGKMAAIVRAIQFCHGEIVVFSDANNMYDLQALRKLLLPFSDSAVGASTGAKHIIEDGRDLSSAEGLYWKYESLIKASESKINSCVSSVGEILAIRREAFVAPKEKIINDDHYIILDLMRRGYRVIYVPDAHSFEYVSLTAQDEIERRTRMNAGLYQTMSLSKHLLPFQNPLLVWQVISHKYFRAIVPFALILLFVSNISIFFFSENGRALLFQTFLYLQFLFYFLAGLGNFINFNGVLGKVFYIPVFLFNSNLATLKGFYKFVANKQLHVWNRVGR